MQAVCAVVHGQLIFLAVQSKLAVFNAIGYTTDHGVEVCFLGAPLVQGIETKHYIGFHALVVRYNQ